MRLKGVLLAFCLMIGFIARPAMAENPADAAARTLVRTYDARTGQWDDVNWWQTANALTALIDHMRARGQNGNLSLVLDSLARNRSWEFGDYKGDSTDDTAWWALALVDLYDLTGDRQWLELARTDEAYIYGYWDGACGGGLWWDIKRTYKNAISNELYLQLAAALHNRLPGDKIYIARAERTWDWLKRSGMINAQNLINDGLNVTKTGCRNNGGATFSYNQGVILGGLIELAQAHKDHEDLLAARRIAQAVIRSPDLSPDGILREPCETDESCEIDGTSFKGIFVRNLSRLDRALPDHPFRDYLRAQAASIAAHDRAGDDFGLSWSGPFDRASTGREQSALDAFNAAE